MNLHGKVVLLTGASRGIGRALALALAPRCRLLLTALEEVELKALEKELARGHSSKVAAFPADLSDPCQLNELLAWVREQSDPPSILINNAGGGYFRRFASSSWSDVEKTLCLNIHAPTHLTLELIPLLKEQPQAKIVNISSAIARLPYPGLAAYGASKGFVTSLSESLVCELAGTSLSILCFHPGFSETLFMNSAGMDMKRVPKFLIKPPEKVAERIIQAMEKDRVRDFSDLSTRLATSLGELLPIRIKERIFRNLFWRLPNEE